MVVGVEEEVVEGVVATPAGLLTLPQPASMLVVDAKLSAISPMIAFFISCSPFAWEGPLAGPSVARGAAGLV
jgi:hypothetical protein